jgi:hypothetical protein
VAAFATPEDLRLLLRLPTIDEAAATLLLDLATSAVLAEIRQDVVQVVNDVVTLDGTGTTTLLLPQIPVTAVESVTERGLPLAVDADYTWSGAGVLTRLCGRWPTRPRSVQVVYTHGYPDGELPGILRTVTVQAAARVWVNPRQMTSESIGDWSGSFGAAGTGPGRIDLTDWEKGLLAQLKASNGGGR